jgi:hypothetical protein
VGESNLEANTLRLLSTCLQLKEYIGEKGKASVCVKYARDYAEEKAKVIQRYFLDMADVARREGNHIKAEEYSRRAVGIMDAKERILRFLDRMFVE